jgi:hypothetical protein
MRCDSTATRRVFLLAPLAAVFLAAGCASTPSPTYTPPAAGSTFVYRVTSTGSYGSGTTDVPMRIESTTFEGRSAMRYTTPAGSTVNETATAATIVVTNPAGTVMMRYDPPLGQPWPLAVGKTATQDIRLTYGPTTTVPMKADWKVEGVEDVSVPAGTFRAWRVTMADSFGYRQTNWSVPDRLGMFAKRESIRPAGHPQGAGTQLMELMSAPVR